MKYLLLQEESMLDQVSGEVMQNAVDSVLARLTKELKTTPSFLAAHFSCGAPGEPGYIIKSAATAIDCLLATWASTENAMPSLHSDVIIRHARQFQRSITVPALLA